MATAQLALVKNGKDLNSQLVRAQGAMSTLKEGRSRFPSNRGIRAKIREANKQIAALVKNQNIEQNNRKADLVNKRNMKTRILKLQERIRKAEELKRKQGIYPANYETDKKDFEQTVAQYKKLYGPLNF